MEELCLGAFFGFLIFFGLAKAVTLDEVLGLALANTYQLEEKWHLLEAARLEKKGLYVLFGPRINTSYTASLNEPQIWYLTESRHLI